MTCLTNLKWPDNMTASFRIELGTSNLSMRRCVLDKDTLRLFSIEAEQSIRWVAQIDARLAKGDLPDEKFLGHTRR